MITTIFMALGVSIGINAIFFLFAFWLKSDVFTDITYASTFLITTIIISIFNESYGVVQMIMLTLVALWSIRLGTFLMIRIWKTKIDHRFDKMRNSFWKFGAFWLLQGITVWIVNMPNFLASVNPKADLVFWSIIFVFLAVFFLITETIADFQKYNWTRKKPGKFISNGLWRISRHPNYFSEYMFWIMMFAFFISNEYKPINFAGIISPLFIMFTLYKLSGLPMVEKWAFKTFKQDPDFIKYINETPTLVPFFGKKGIKSKWKS